MPKIDEVFKETYPQLAEQLEELGINSTIQLKERFESNGKYLNEVLDYDLKDNEKIRSIAEDPPQIPVAVGRRDIATILSALFVIGLLLFFGYQFWNFTKYIFNY